MKQSIISVAWMVSLLFSREATPQDFATSIIKPNLVFQEVDGIVAVEAEHFASQDKTDVRAWYRVEEDRVPEIKPDPDGPHLLGSSGACYVEALPDSRATHDDKIVNGESYFSKPSQAGVHTYN